MPDLVQFSKVIMHIFGTGKKGTITFDIIKAFYKSLQTIGVNERDQSSLPMLIFAKLDTNNNYYYSYKELEYILHLHRPKSSKDKSTKKDAKRIIHEQKPACENWGLPRDEFIKLFDPYISSPNEEIDILNNSPISSIVAAGLNRHHQIGENPKPSQPSKLNLMADVQNGAVWLLANATRL